MSSDRFQPLIEIYSLAARSEKKSEWALDFKPHQRSPQEVRKKGKKMQKRREEKIMIETGFEKPDQLVAAAAAIRSFG